jgi:hypothetical protein
MVLIYDNAKKYIAIVEKKAIEDIIYQQRRYSSWGKK